MRDEQVSPRDARLRRIVLFDGIALLFVALATAAYFAVDALLLLFGCVLFGVLLNELAAMIGRHARLSHKPALAVAVVALLAVIGIGGWAMAPQIAEQSEQLARQLPEALANLRRAIDEHPLLRQLARQLPPPEAMMKSLGQFVPNAGLLFGGALGALGNVVIIAVVGIYLAAAPAVYVRGFLKLVPPARRARAADVLHQTGEALARWLVAKAVCMLIVGVVTSVGLSLLGVPLGLILGVIAGLLDFIPYVGPIMAGVPAVLIALSGGPDLALYVVLLFLGIQLVEGYVLEPLIEGRAVNIPPAFTVVMQLILGALFGFAGVALALPLTAAGMVLVRMLYVEDVLGDKAEKS